MRRRKAKEQPVAEAPHWTTVRRRVWLDDNDHAIKTATFRSLEYRDLICVIVGEGKKASSFLYYHLEPVPSLVVALARRKILIIQNRVRPHAKAK